MPMLYVFRRVSELQNRQGWIHVPDDALAARLLKEGKAAPRFNGQRVEPAPRPGSAAAIQAAATESVAPAPPADDEPPRKSRKSTK
jgi:hypothetical protein